MVYPITKRTILPLLKLFIKKTDGIENIPKSGPFIIVSNHESYLDPLFIVSIIVPIINRKIHFLSIKGRFWDKFGDTISRKWAGCISVDEGKEKAFDGLLDLLKQGGVISLFIEGIRSDGSKLLRGKTGAVRLALEAKVPILPVGLIGTYDVAPGEGLLPRLRRAKISIGKPILMEKYYNKKIEYVLLRKLTDSVMQGLSQLTGNPYCH